MVSTVSDVDNNVYCSVSPGIVLKVASDGTLVWQNSILQSGVAVSVSKLSGLSLNLIPIIGGTGSGAVSSRPATVLLNSDGTISSSKYINTGVSSFFSGAATSPEGSLYISGRIISGRTDLFRIYNGSIVTKKTYSNATDGLFFIGGGYGDTAYLGDPFYGVVSCITKVDSNLSILWKLKSSGFLIKQVVELNGFAYAVAAYSSRIYILKFDAGSGTVVWSKILSPALGSCIAVDISGNIYAGGYNTSTKLGIVLKVNSDGVLQWQRSVSIDGLPSYDSTTISSISVNDTNNTICMLASPAYNSTAYSILLSVPTDGTLTGTYTAGGTSVVYANHSASFSSLSPTLSLASVSFGTSSLSDLNFTTSSSSSSLTYNKVSIP